MEPMQVSGTVEEPFGELRFPCMNVQCNWNEEGAKEKGKFWISCKMPQDKTIHGHIHGPISVLAEGEAAKPVDNKFIVTRTTQRSMTVECTEVEEGCATTFIRPIKTIHLHHKKLVCMDISVSGGLGVCASDGGKMWVWNADNGDTRRELEGHLMDIETCRFFPSGVVILSGGSDMMLKIWSAQDGSCPRTLFGHTAGITDTAIIDRGKNIVSVSRDGTARLWDCGSSRCLAKIAELKCPIVRCSLSASAAVAERNPAPPIEPECGTNDKMLLLACGDGYMRIYDIRSRNRVCEYYCGASSLSSCVFVSEHQAVCGSADGLITTIDVRKARDDRADQMYHSTSPVTSLCPLNANTRACLAGYADGSTICWSLDDVAPPQSKLTGPDIDHVTAIHVRGDNVFTSCRDGCIRVYTTADMPLPHS